MADGPGSGGAPHDRPRVADPGPTGDELRSIRHEWRARRLVFAVASTAFGALAVLGLVSGRPWIGATALLAALALATSALFSTGAAEHVGSAGPGAS